MADSTDSQPVCAWFTPTRWSVVSEARQWPSPEAFEALSELCAIYRAPIYSFLRRRYSPHDAEDLTQSFFEHLLRKEFLKNVERGEGRFRSFLLKCLKHYLINRHAKDSLKPKLVLTEEDPDTALIDNSPDRAFDQAWAISLVQSTFATLECEFASKGKTAMFTCLRPHLTGDLDAPPYAALSAELAMAEGAVRKAVYDLRRRFGELLRAKVAETLATTAEIDDELRHVMNAWINAGAPRPDV